MKTYESMKPSNVLWLGSIPEHWTMKRNITLLTERDERSKKGEEQLLSLSQYTGITIRGKNSTKMGMHEAESLVGYKIVRENDIVMNIMLAWNGSTAKSKFEGIISPAYAVYHLIDDSANPDYLHYLYKTPYFMQYFEAYSTGLIKSRLRLYPQSFLHLSSIVPPREEQDQIVRFLDWKVSEINKIIKLRKTQIERLEEMKRTVVSKAVASDKYPKVPFQYCAWIRARLGWRGLKAHEYVDSGYPFLSAFNIVNNHLSWNELNFINQERYDESPEIKLAVGDILLVKDGAGIGKCARIDELPCGEATTNGSLAVITPNDKLHYRFLYYYLIGNDFKNATNLILTGMGVPHLTQHFLKGVEIPIPEYSEQVKIADMLDAKCSEFDSIITIKHSQIQALHEFKTRLISDVVTGKIDVRGIEIPEYEYTAEEADTDSEAEAEELDEQEGE